jgi:hypothetical protein
VEKLTDVVLFLPWIKHCTHFVLEILSNSIGSITLFSTVEQFIFFERRARSLYGLRRDLDQMDGRTQFGTWLCLNNDLRPFFLCYNNLELLEDSTLFHVGIHLGDARI